MKILSQKSNRKIAKKNRKNSGEISAKNFDENRLARAVSRAAKANRIPAGDAENLAKNVVKKLAEFFAQKPEISARELRFETAGELANFDAETAYLYENENKIF